MVNEIIEELKRSSMLDEVLLGGDELERRLNENEREETDRLIEFVRYRPMLEAVFQNPLDRGDIERELEISRATSHRFTKRLIELGLIRKTDRKFHLTGYGEVVLDEVFRFETNVRAGRRLAPLLDAICEYHREFVVGPFADAHVTTAEPANPYAPMERFVSLVDETETFRGFNTTQMAPPSIGTLGGGLFAGIDAEIIYLPETIETVLANDPRRTRSAIESGSLRLRSRDSLPYGLAIFDESVGIGGYDEDTGMLRVFVDTDAVIAREWAEGVYELFAADSEPIDGHLDRGERDDTERDDAEPCDAEAAPNVGLHR